MSSESLPSSAPDASPAPRCFLLEALGRDNGALFSVLCCLSLNDIAPFSAGCKTSRAFLDSPNIVVNRLRCVPQSKLPLLGGWVVKFISQIVLEREPVTQAALDETAKRGPNMGPVDPSADVSVLETSLKIATSRFPRLQWLQIDTALSGVRDEVMVACFAAMGDRLLGLRLTHNSLAEANDEFVQCVMRNVALLRRLCVLHFEGPIAWPETLLFDNLPKLPDLASFTIVTEFRPSPQQARCLAACRKLASLKCGRWDADPALFEADPPVDEETQLAERIGVLVEAKRPRPDDPEADTLSTLYLKTTELGSAVWPFVCQLTALKSLWPICITNPVRDQWRALESLPAMTCLCLWPDTDNLEMLQVADFLPHVLKCPQLEQLSLGRGMSISAAQLEAICTTLPNLWSLVLHEMLIESLAPLALGPLLRDVEVSRCTGLLGEPLLACSKLPAMPVLRDLVLEEPYAHRLSVAELEPQLAAIRARCPKLKNLRHKRKPSLPQL